ncbi:hypothetical protein AB8613_14945 [Vibrio sp. BS-M-Sm-2]|uniref:hypothetical protein n=1 Tax=Vibrio sp. BS-M-Sm-2 TaxID=3241167 RepID=UPI0035576F42
MNQNDSSGSLIKPWPVLLDHYTGHWQKNWPISDTVNGADASAMLYSIVEIAEAKSDIDALPP